MVAVAALSKLALLGATVGTILDPAWALPANTFLLIALTVVTWKIGQRTHSKVDAVKTVAEENKQATETLSEISSAAAIAAGHAATAAADAARITKDLGGAIRRTDLPNGGTQ